MASLLQICTTGLSFLASLSFLSLLLSLNTGVHGATLREPRLWGKEPNAFRPSSQTPPPPSAAMLQALQYIQSLSKWTQHESVANLHKPGVSDDDLDDLEPVRAMLQLATPARTRDSRGEEDSRDGEEEREEEKAQHWIQAVLNTLQQSEDQMSPPKTPHREPTHSLTPTRLHLMLSPAVEAKQQPDGWTGAEDYGRSLWNSQGIRRHHRRFPQLFEEKDGQDQPLKRTNENAEEQYTPQKLATLQSVFEELSRMPNSKADSKQPNTEYSEDGEDSDRYREKKMVFDNVAGDEEELMPLEERTEQVEEEIQRHNFNRAFGDDGKGQEKEDRDAEGEDKRSKQSDLLEMRDPDDMSRLVDYYLMKVLEQTELEEQKRDQEKENEEGEEEEEEEGEEEENEREEERREDDDEEEEEEEEEEEDEERDKRGAAQLQYMMDPRSLKHLIQISKKLQVSRNDILDLLEREEANKLSKSWQRRLPQSRTPSLRYSSSYNTHKSPVTAFYQRPLQTPEMSSVTQDILRILGLAKAEKPSGKSLLRPNQYKSAPALNYYMAERELPDYTFSETSKDQQEVDSDDAMGEDELASLLATEMLAQRQRRATLAHHDYYDQAIQSMTDNRQTAREEATGNSDEEELLRILNYLNPEREDTDETDVKGKTVSGM